MIRLCVNIYLILITSCIWSQDRSIIINNILSLQDQEQYRQSIEEIDNLLQSYGEETVDSIYALATHKKAVAYYYLGQEEEAISYWKKAINYRETLFPSGHMDIIKGLRNIANSYQNLDQLYLARSFYDQSLSQHLKKEIKDDKLLARTYAELGYVYTRLGDFGIAKDYLILAEGLYKQEFQEEPWELGLLYEYMYDNYVLQEDHIQMNNYAQKSIDLYSSFDELYDEDYIGLANAYNNMGIFHDLTTDHRQALEYYRQSLEINLTFGDQRLPEIADNYTNIAVAYNELGDYDKATNAIHKAIEKSKALNDRIRISSDFENLAEIQINKQL